MLVYLGICAVGAFLAALISLHGTIPPAPAFHIFFAAGAMPLIFGAIIHFVPVLTRTAAPAAAISRLPLLLQLAGIATPLALIGWLPQWALHAAASVTVVAALALLFWITRRLRATLDTPHPGAHWYGAALLCLFCAVSLVPLWLALPELRPALRLFHLHLNTLGFIGLAALGTLPLLLPTAAGQPEPDARARLGRHLLPATAGALLIAAGAATAALLALPGALLLGGVGVANLIAWQRAYGVKVGSQRTAPLAVATAGFVLLLLHGLAHAAGWVAARPALSAYVVLFLLPLVSGALAQLLPVWRHPGPDAPARQRVRQQLASGGQWRSMLFLLSGALLLSDVPLAWLPAILALAWFALRLGVALYNPR